MLVAIDLNTGVERLDSDRVKSPTDERGGGLATLAGLRNAYKDASEKLRRYAEQGHGGMRKRESIAVRGEVVRQAPNI